jgi:hypothetical protein
MASYIPRIIDQIVSHASEDFLTAVASVSTWESAEFIVSIQLVVVVVVVESLSFGTTSFVSTLNIYPSVFRTAYCSVPFKSNIYILVCSFVASLLDGWTEGPNLVSLYRGETISGRILLAREAH